MEIKLPFSSMKRQSFQVEPKKECLAHKDNYYVIYV